ncbi:MAG: hypothetical protein ACRDCE_19390, partial [Cetobacterium sp.]|uniref:hypothetical protein n=1 Tax=Cetobacterium sp. TaxID=2071632 RepID=UPI003EE667F2
MKKNLIVTAMLAASVMLAGCGDTPPKTDQQIQFEQQKEMLRIQQQHEREMAKINAGVYNEPTIINHPNAVYSGSNEQYHPQAEY